MNTETDAAAFERIKRERKANCAKGKFTERNGGKGFNCLCPAHNDRKQPSLSVDLKNDRLLVHCHAGCTQERLRAALGIERDPRPLNGTRRAWWHHEWEYRSANGGPDVKVRRKDEADGGKTIRRHPTKVEGPFKPLYFDQLPDDPAAAIVIVEGEKTCDAVRAAGFAATTGIGGKQLAATTDWSGIANRERVVLWPDADEQGRGAMNELARLLDMQNCELRIVDTGRFETGHDAADFDPDAVKEILHDAIMREGGETELPAAPETEPPLKLTEPRWFVVDPTRNPPEHILPGVLEVSGNSVLFGRPGDGKSTMAVAEILSVATGRNLVGEGDVQRSKVMVLWDDESEDSMHTKMTAAMSHYDIQPGEIAERIAWLGGPEAGQKWDGDLRNEHYEYVCGWIEERMRKLECRVLYIDSLSSVSPDAETENMLATSILKRLERIAVALGGAVRLLHHSRKGPPGEKRAADLDEARGASAITARCRIVQQIRAEAYGKDRTYELTTVKGSNFLAGEPSSWKMEGVAVGTEGRTAQVMVPHEVPNPFEGMQGKAQAIVDAICDAPPEHRRASRTASGWAGYIVAEVMDWDIAPGTKNASERSTEQNLVRGRIEKVLATWHRNRVLKRTEVKQRNGRGSPVFERGPVMPNAKQQ